MKPVQGSLFEEDFLLRTLGPLGYSPDVALSELVANAWDAGASRVEITIPSEVGQELTVTDDGTGMTPEQFRARWMTLGYSRVRHQGADAEFPLEREELRRVAYGRNGVGRHGLLCFGKEYAVETWRDGVAVMGTVSTSSGDQPFVLRSQISTARPGHGTRVSVRVTHHLPDPDRIRDELSAKFLHDPQFSVLVNGRSVPLTEHAGLIERQAIILGGGKTAEIFVIDLAQVTHGPRHQGVAFWVGSRLVGEPSWIVGKTAVIDGRTRVARRYTAIVKSDSLFDDVLPDYSAFRDTETTRCLFLRVSEYVTAMVRRVAAEWIEETKSVVLAEHSAEIENLEPLGQLEVREFIGDLADRQPLGSPEVMSAAVQAVINLERSRSGAGLLEKLAKLSDEDIEGLNRLLSEWSVRDALTVLDEIGRRLAVIEAIKRLSSDSSVDEVHTLHPLVASALWLFGPEYDSAEYASNVSLTTAVQQVFGKRVSADAFDNSRRRPDLLILKDATLCAVATETYDDVRALQTLRDVLLIELKRGGSTISRDHVHQASDYVEDLRTCGYLDGPPYIHAFVVGHRASDKIETTRSIGDSPVQARIDVVTYGQLVRTGEKRLFALRNRLRSRYEEISGVDLLRSISTVASRENLLPFDGDDYREPPR
jgi:hypothetical protein